MFFVISKVLGFFATPSNAIASICVVGILLHLIGRRRVASRCLITGVALLLLFGFSPVGSLLLLPLTERFPAWQSDGRDPDGVIVLDGAINAEVSDVRGSLELDSAAERVLTMLALARRFPAAKIVFSGGSGSLVPDSPSEAPVAERLLEQFGVERSRIVLEGMSRNTAENAIFTKQMLMPKPSERWLLVTSAFHMPRSIGAFRAAGFEIEAYPVDWRTRGWVDAALPFDAISGGLARTDVAVHEWIGLIAYWLTKRSSELFPGPRSVVTR